MFFSDFVPFLTCFRRLTHVIAIGWMSVRPSVTHWYCIKTAAHIVMLSSPHDSPFILVLCISRSSRNSDGVTPCGGAKQRWYENVAVFDQYFSISQKWLKIHGYIQRGVLQALNSLSNRVTFTAIVPGAYPGPGETKMCKKCANMAKL